MGLFNTENAYTGECKDLYVGINMDNMRYIAINLNRF